MHPTIPIQVLSTDRHRGWFRVMEKWVGLDSVFRPARVRELDRPDQELCSDLDGALSAEALLASFEGEKCSMRYSYSHSKDSAIKRQDRYFLIWRERL